MLVRGSSIGIVRAFQTGMTATKHEHLEAWQLADQLKIEVYALIKDAPAARDFEFRNQIRDSAAFATKNTSEGFGGFRPKVFAKFMEYAVESLIETQDSLKDGIDRGYFTPGRVAPAQKLARRAIQVSPRLIVYL